MFTPKATITNHHLLPTLLPRLLVLSFGWTFLLRCKSLFPLAFSILVLTLQLGNDPITRLQLIFQLRHYLRALDLDGFQSQRLVLHHSSFLQDVGLVLLYRSILEEELFFLSVRKTGNSLQLFLNSCCSRLLSELWL